MGSQAGHGPPGARIPGADERQAGPGHRNRHLQETAGRRGDQTGQRRLQRNHPRAADQWRCTPELQQWIRLQQWIWLWWRLVWWFWWSEWWYHYQVHSLNIQCRQTLLKRRAVPLPLQKLL